MNNYISQILNDDFNVFFFSDFCYQSLIFVSTAGAGCTLTLITTSGSHHSQFLKSMVMSTSTMSHKQQALTPESASLTDFSLDLN